MKEKRSAFEWLVIALSSILTLVVFSFLLHQALMAGNSDLMPDVALSFEATGPGPDGQFQVAVTAHNRGPAPAEQVGVEVRLVGAPEEEQVDFEVQRLPREASTKVWVTFTQDPRLPGRSVKARVTHARLP